MENEVYDKLLNECSKEYKILLKEYLIRNNLNTISDIVKVDNRVKRNFLSNRIKYKRLLFIVIELYTIMLIVILFSIGNYTVNEYIIFSSILIVSVLELLMSYRITNKLRNKAKNMKSYDENNYIINYYRVVSSWRKIEAISNDLKIKNEKTYINNIRTIDFLKNNKFINYEEELALKKLLECRNHIAHDVDFDRNIDKYYNVNELIDIANKVIGRLESIRG